MKTLIDIPEDLSAMGPEELEFFRRERDFRHRASECRVNASGELVNLHEEAQRRQHDRPEPSKRERDAAALRESVSHFTRRKV